MTEQDPAPSDHVDAVTDAVLAASRVLGSVSARALAAVDESLSPAQFRVLAALSEDEPRKVTELAAALAVNPSTATRAVERLVAEGFVDRRPNPRSRREALVSLTGTGRRVVRAVARRRRAEVAAIVARMPRTHQRGLVRALTAFSMAGTEPPATHTQGPG